MPRSHSLVASFALCGVSLAQTDWSPTVQLDSKVQDIDRVEHADLNGDGRQDVLLVALGTGRVAVALALGPEEFKVPHIEVDALSQVFVTSTTVSGHRVALDDLDGDGHIDLFSALTYTALNAQTVLHVAFGRGDGTFELAPALPPLPSLSGDIAIADVDGDGLLDLAVAGLDQSLVVHRGLGARSFASRVPLVDGSVGSRALEFRDFDGDGAVDLLAQTFDARGSLANLNLFFGTGSLPYSRSNAVALDGNPMTIDVADLDLDGDLDVVAWEASPIRPSIIEGLGGQSFAPGVPGQAGEFNERGTLADSTVTDFPISSTPSAMDRCASPVTLASFSSRSVRPHSTTAETRSRSSMRTVMAFRTARALRSPRPQRSRRS